MTTVKTQSIDTPPEIEEVLVRRLRELTPTERLGRMYELTAAARALSAQGIRARHGPGITEREVILRLAAQSLDRETMVRVFQWDPEVRGY